MVRGLLPGGVGFASVSPRYDGEESATWQTLFTSVSVHDERTWGWYRFPPDTLVENRGIEIERLPACGSRGTEAGIGTRPRRCGWKTALRRPLAVAGGDEPLEHCCPAQGFSRGEIACLRFSSRYPADCYRFIAISGILCLRFRPLEAKSFTVQAKSQATDCLALVAVAVSH